MPHTQPTPMDIWCSCTSPSSRLQLAYDACCGKRRWRNHHGCYGSRWWKGSVEGRSIHQWKLVGKWETQRQLLPDMAFSVLSIGEDISKCQYIISISFPFLSILMVHSPVITLCWLQSFSALKLTLTKWGPYFKNDETLYNLTYSYFSVNGFYFEDTCRLMVPSIQSLTCLSVVPLMLQRNGSEATPDKEVIP